MRLQTISESIKLVSEAHVDTDQMMYADGIAKAMQTQKTELSNLWSAEILNSSSDFVTGNGGGRIKYTIPSVPNEVDFRVELLNRKSPEPQIDELGNEVAGDDVPEDTADVKISVSINDNPIQETTLTSQPLTGLLEAVTSSVMSIVNEYNQKQKVA